MIGRFVESASIKDTLSIKVQQIGEAPKVAY
jgi:hypothetical protein